jgi:hypothetical protein
MHVTTERTDPNPRIVLVDIHGRHRHLIQRIAEGEWKYVVGTGRSGETDPVERIEDVIQRVILGRKTVVARTVDSRRPAQRSGVTVPGKSIRAYWLEPALRHLVQQAATQSLKNVPPNEELGPPKFERTKSPLHDASLAVVQHGAKASEETPYVVYEYWWNDRPFYVGVGGTLLRANGRWGHVKNLVRLETEGTIPSGKKADLARLSNQVIAALIKRGLEPYEVHEYCRVMGKSAAERVESKRIVELAGLGCVLANRAGNPRLGSLEEVLAYLEVPGANT